MTTKQARHIRSERTAQDFEEFLLDNLYYIRGETARSASWYDVYFALAHTVRDYLVESWRKTAHAYFDQNPKIVYYLSAEYLLGRQLSQNLLYTGTTEQARQALAAYNLELEPFIEMDVEPGLGNGGLGRLAACYLDSLATLGIPAVGYGIRYEYGIFKQNFENGWQVESPDDWLFMDNPWEFSQPDDRVSVNFGGHTQFADDGHGGYRVEWLPAYSVLGEPYHMLVPGYGNQMVNMLRLWRARASQEFDLRFFDVGDYAKAVEQKMISENISKVLYPNDSTSQGRELRLKQQYFFVSCSLRDIIRDYCLRNKGWEYFPEKVVIHLNDTHPTIAIVELMRILVDEQLLEWSAAWEITSRTFAYTCHTLLPEALEKWPVGLFEYLLPRHLEIIYEINRRFLESVSARFPDDEARIARMSIIEEGVDRQVRMAHLASVGCFSINGVAELHTRLLRETTLRDFAELWPEKFNNKTNGVTPRRFVRMANPALAELITSKIGSAWLTDLDQLARLEPLVDDPEFCQAWRAVKRQNKQALAEYLYQNCGVEVDKESLFDIMVKRLHEYKRQLLKVLHIITLYQRLLHNPEMEIQPRTFIFGAKAAPGYHMAKLIIKLINSVAETVNNDPLVRGRLKVAFPPNFNVTMGEKIYPAADLSEQISMAGKEASGTGNMKFALNGALTIGTLDGANIEIRELVGNENFFCFGLTADEAQALKASGYRPMDDYASSAELRQAIDVISNGDFSPESRDLFRPIIDMLLYSDPFLVLADYSAYIASQDQVDAAYQDQENWTRKSILNVARCGFFSSDRSVRQYCEDIWGVEPMKIV